MNRRVIPPAGFTRCVDTGDAIAGGFLYGGTAIPQLRGHYLFGDIVDERLFHARARDATGELYLLSKANGKIWRLKRAPPPIMDGGQLH